MTDCVFLSQAFLSSLMKVLVGEEVLQEWVTKDFAHHQVTFRLDTVVFMHNIDSKLCAVFLGGSYTSTYIS